MWIVVGNRRTMVPTIRKKDIFRHMIVALAVSLQFCCAVLPREHSNSSLVMILTLFRHGARSPIITLPSDQHANFPWEGGLEALQPQGYEELYTLGQNMRERYSYFIPKSVFKIKHSIYAASSSTERCINSAQSFLTGLLKTSNSSAIRHQPVPLHIILPDEDTSM
ncbi:testicular acid phosphatase homolog isoform X2 [Malaya genurostris]|uniref:testicular acid phosphatase homolog isoform X2 n=1 Tax=Malaya genurostris TaxID=325434 RepID=UPI0026F38B65|nr:testicular acid phosphatase homolog isoform X2 [Malaya genurostris]